MKAGVTRIGVFALLAAAVIGCSGGGTKTDNTNEMTQRQQAASLNAQLASDYLRQGNWEQAKNKVDRALDQDPQSVQAHMVAGLLYNNLGEKAKAESHLQKAVSLDGENPEARNALAGVLCSHGKYEAGEKQALTAAADPLYKTPEYALLNAGRCARNAGDLKRAETHFRRALSLQPRFSQALFDMADLEFRAGNFMPARAFLERHMAAAPITPAALLLGIRIEKALGTRNIAADYARRLKSDYPTSDEAKVLTELEKAGR